MEASQRIGMGLALVLVTMLMGRAAAQSSDCTNVIISLSPCLNYITGNSSIPSSACCTQLASVVRSQPQCLCLVLDGRSSSLGLNINQTQALALPGACKVQTPPISSCNVGSPAGAPTGTPGTQNTVPSGRGSNTVPSYGTSLKLRTPLLFFFLFIASYSSALPM